MRDVGPLAGRQSDVDSKFEIVADCTLNDSEIAVIWICVRWYVCVCMCHSILFKVGNQTKAVGFRRVYSPEISFLSQNSCKIKKGMRSKLTAKYFEVESEKEMFISCRKCLNS